jgi:hypothetical protein
LFFSFLLCSFIYLYQCLIFHLLSRLYLYHIRTDKQTHFVTASTFVSLSLSLSPSSTFCISSLARNNRGLPPACHVSI